MHMIKDHMQGGCPRDIWRMRVLVAQKQLGIMSVCNDSMDLPTLSVSSFRPVECNCKQTAFGSIQNVCSQKSHAV